MLAASGDVIFRTLKLLTFLYFTGMNVVQTFIVILIIISMRIMLDRRHKISILEEVFLSSGYKPSDNLFNILTDDFKWNFNARPYTCTAFVAGKKTCFLQLLHFTTVCPVEIGPYIAC
jgi:hypothetical protein